MGKKWARAYADDIDHKKLSEVEQQVATVLHWDMVVDGEPAGTTAAHVVSLVLAAYRPDLVLEMDAEEFSQWLKRRRACPASGSSCAANSPSS